MSTKDWGKNGPLSRAIQERAGLAGLCKEASTKVAASMFRLGERDLPDPLPGYSEGARQIFKERRAEVRVKVLHDRLAQGEETEVRKDNPAGARQLIEKAADQIPGDEVDPAQVLTGAQRLLLDEFRKQTGRDPGSEDATYWRAYAQIIESLKAEMGKQGT